MAIINKLGPSKMMKLKEIVKAESELKKFTQKVQKILNYPSLLLLFGNLGSGKTTFCKYLLENFGLSRNQVKSPTYSLINNFHTDHLNINHIDLYRLDKPDLILTEEIKQLISVPGSLTLIEWPERLNLNQLIRPQLQILKINLNILDSNSRQIIIEKIN